MTITVNRTDLIAALTSLARVVEKRNNIPVLANVLVEAVKGRDLTLSTTDLDLTLSVKVRDAKVLSTMSFTVGVHNLLDMAKRAKSATVMIDLPDAETAQFHMGSLNIKLNTLPVEDFPKPLQLKELHAFAMPTEELLDALERCLPSVSNEETRYYLNGVYINVVRRELRFTATDGHRLATRKMLVPAGAEKIPAMIVPGETVVELIRACKAKDASAKTNIFVMADDDHSRLVFRIDHQRFETKLIDGAFPDYERVIPTGNDKTLVLDREEAIDAIKAVSAMSSEKGRAVKLSMNGKTTFTVKNPDSGSASMTIEGELRDAEKRRTQMDIGFNSRYLLSIFEQMASDKVTLKLGDSGSPTLFTGRDDKNALHVLMPNRHYLTDKGRAYLKGTES